MAAKKLIVKRWFQLVLATATLLTVWVVATDRWRERPLTKSFPVLAQRFSGMESFRCDADEATIQKIENAVGIYRDDASDHEGRSGIRLFSPKFDGSLSLVLTDKQAFSTPGIITGLDEEVANAPLETRYVHAYKNFNSGVEQEGISGFLLQGLKNCGWRSYKFDPGPIFFMLETGTDIVGGRTADFFTIGSKLDDGQYCTHNQSPRC